MSTEHEQGTTALWNEVAAERTGSEPVKPAEKPAPAPAATTPAAAITLAPPADFAAKLAEIEARFSDRLRKAEGHIGNLNSTQQDLRAQVDAGKAAKQATGGPTQAEIKDAAANPAEWDALKTDYPEWATATEKLLESRMVGAFDAKAFEATIREEMKGQNAAVRAEMIDSALDAVSPGWKEEVKSDPFKAWAAGQSDAVKALIRSDKVGDAAKMLRLYEVSKQSSPANQLIEQRKATLAAATGAPKGIRNATASKSWADMSAGERWESEKRTRAKQAR